MRSRMSVDVGAGGGAGFEVDGTETRGTGSWRSGRSRRRASLRGGGRLWRHGCGGAARVVPPWGGGGAARGREPPGQSTEEQHEAMDPWSAALLPHSAGIRSSGRHPRGPAVRCVVVG